MLSLCNENLDAALRRVLSSPPMSRCALQGRVMASRKGSSAMPGSPYPALRGTNCTWGALGFLRGGFCEEALIHPSIFSPKVLNTVNPELIWPSTIPGEESAMSCKTQNWVLSRLAARLEQCRALQAVCPCWLRGICWPAFLHPSCRWLHGVTLLPVPCPGLDSSTGQHWAACSHWGCLLK